MSKEIELVVNTDPRTVGHLFCADCATELNVVLSSSKIYRNPNWTSDWDVMWHEFYSVRFVLPHLLMKLLGPNGLKTLDCPYCSYRGKVITMDGGLFDIRLLKHSLDADNSGGYKCVRCEEVYASQKCVTRAGHDYICGDCAAFA